MDNVRPELKLERRLTEILYPVPESVELGIKHFLYEPLTMDYITHSASYLNSCTSLDPYSIPHYPSGKRFALYDFFDKYVLNPDFPFMRVRNIKKVDWYLRELADGEIPATAQEHLNAINAYMSNPTEFLVSVRTFKSYK